MLICSTEMDGNFTPSFLKGGKPEILLRWFFFPHYGNHSEVYIYTCQGLGIRTRWFWSAPPRASPPPCLLPRTPLQLPTALPCPAMAPHQPGPPMGPGPSPRARAVPLLAEAVGRARLPAPDISIRFNKLFPVEYVEGALVTQLMTLSFSVVKLHEETIKNTLNVYLVIFVKHNVIITGNWRGEEMGTCKWDFLNFMVLLNHNSKNSWIMVNILKLT